jgi:hypothetical protein
MKLEITDWIKNGNIFPLKWGDSSIQIEENFKDSVIEIELLRQRNYPFIILDFVEFYFDDDKNYTGLNEVIIKPVSLYNGIVTNFINPNWLTNNLTFTTISAKLTELKIIWEVEYGPAFKTPNIRTSSGTLFAFELDKEKIEDSVLMKIYLHQ